MDSIFIISENNKRVVCVKPVGADSEKDVPAFFSEKGMTVLTVHRLDRDVSGVMVYAKDKGTASSLSRQITDGTFKKEYVAVVNGTVPENGRFEDLLFHDRVKNKTYVVNRKRGGVKRAVLSFSKKASIECDGNVLSLVEIQLETGRTHQIRVQFASRGFPLYGDRKYGSLFKSDIALFSKRIVFKNPKNGCTEVFEADIPDTLPWNYFKNLL